MEKLYKMIHDRAERESTSNLHWNTLDHSTRRWFGAMIAVLDEQLDKKVDKEEENPFKGLMAADPDILGFPRLQAKVDYARSLKDKLIRGNVDFKTTPVYNKKGKGYQNGWKDCFELIMEIVDEIIDDADKEKEVEGILQRR